MTHLTALEKWSYAIGNIPYSVKDTAFGSFVVFYYTQVVGLSGSLAGLAMLIALCWDGITDPVVGSWSDTLRGRWGRRHPPLLFGGIPTALLFLVLFQPPAGLNELSLFFWLLIVSILLRTFLTIYYIPYSALGAELSTDYDERTVIAKARVSVGWVSGMLLTAVAYGVIFQSAGPSDGRLAAENYIHYGQLSALLAGACAIFCIIGTRTVIPRLPQVAATATPFTLGQTLEDVRIAIGNRNFRFKVGASLAVGMASGVYTTLSLYIGTYFWELSSAQLGGLVVPAAIATLLAFVYLHRWGRKYSKVQLLCAASIVLTINISWLVGARLLDWLPQNGHPIIYPLMLINAGISVLAIVTLQVLSVSVMADILDEQELKTGLRQEGIFFAASSFINKVTTGMGAFFGGIIIDIAGITPGSEPGTVDDAVLWQLGALSTGIIATLTLTAFFCYRRMTMERDYHQQVQAELANASAQRN